MSVFNSAIWDIAGRVANYFVTFAVSIVLTRLLNPSEFGAFGVVLAVSVFSWVVLEFGFRSAVVQAAEVSQTQLSTVFWVNLLIGTLIAVILAIVSGPIEGFYGIHDLAKYLIGISPVFVLNGLIIVPSALIQKQLKLKQTSILSVIAAAISGAVAIGMAFRGFGVWSLIAANVISGAVTLVGAYAIAKWRPSLTFDLPSIKPLFDFGYRIFLSSLLDVVFTRADVFIIAKLFDAVTLGFYTRAQSLDQQVRMFSVSSIVTVMLPVFSKFQNDLEGLRKMYLRSLHFVSFVTIAAAGLMFLTADDVFIILFTEKWSPSANYLQLMVIASAFYPLNYLLLNLISGKGNSRAMLRLEITKKAILTPTYLSFIFGGIFTFLAALIVVNGASLVLTMTTVAREVDTKVSRQLTVVGMYAAMTALSASFAYGVIALFSLSTVPHFFGLCIAFATAYITLNWWFQPEGFVEFSSRVTSALASLKKLPAT